MLREFQRVQRQTSGFSCGRIGYYANQNSPQSYSFPPLSVCACVCLSVCIRSKEYAIARCESQSLIFQTSSFFVGYPDGNMIPW